MAYILPCRNKTPDIHSSVFLAPNATISGEVEIGEHCTIWFNTVLRGDVHFIKIGKYTNVQDNATIHGTFEKSPTHIHDFVSIGHNAIVHGCTIKNNVLVGMGAIVMDDAVIEPNCMVAAGAVVLQNTHLESGFLYAGVPAKKIKPLSDEQLKLLEELPYRYVKYSKWYTLD